MKQLPTAHMPAPDLLLESEGRVSSAQFGDIYFSRAGGEAETRHVFLQGNHLPARFAGRRNFTIGELGFGTGLNFLTVWKEFLATTDATQHLHYISVEKYPLTRAQFDAVSHAGALYEALRHSYPLRLPGWHRIHLERCTLTLGFGDAEELLSGGDAQIDAWFLDGFAPAKNPDMWSEGLFAHLGRLSAPDASFATFTAAGAVKRALQAQGFAVEKTQGYGHKRDMLVGRRKGAPAMPRATPAQILVIGAGIAGCTLARALAERGIQVTIFDRHGVAGGASGNPAAALYPQLTKFYTPATAWHATGYGFMLRQLARWKKAGLDFTFAQPGMLRLPRVGSPQQMLQTLQLDEGIARYVTCEEAGGLAGVAVASDGIYLPQGSWIKPGELCRALLQHKNITLHEHCEITALERYGDGWLARSDGPDFLASHVAVCAAHQAAALVPQVTVPTGISAGQVTMLAAASPLPEKMISHRGYIISLGDKLLVGATYDHEDFSCTVTRPNHEENRQHARAALPEMELGEIIGGRTSLRATTPDRLPYVGAVGEGLYVSIGHGSRGMISAPLAAEIIAAQMLGGMVPLTPELRDAIDPLRRSQHQRLRKSLAGE
jgi:tRNA 5-methylaminomethyl-2-thiouridine biosynthesis bifunctional protein